MVSLEMPASRQSAWNFSADTMSRPTGSQSSLCHLKPTAVFAGSRGARRDDLLHAARIDGCGEFEIYWKIVLPMCRPAMAALGVMLLIGSWNNLMTAFLMLRTPDMQTLPVLIYLLQGETRTPFGMLMAGGLLTTLPLVIAFLLFQRQFISGATAGAVKQ